MREDIAFAQGPQVVSVFPAGGARGTTIALKVEGTGLEGASKALVSGPGMRVVMVSPDAEGKATTVRLVVAADAPLGSRELRIVTPKGVSNPLRLWVDIFPNSSEAEPDDDATHAQGIPKTPSVLNGQLEKAGDQNLFAFQANANETWVFDVNAARLNSPLDPQLELRDEAGVSIPLPSSVLPEDPRLIVTLEKSGRYVLTLHDARGRGGQGYIYRLTAGTLPVITGFLPRGEKSGRSVNLLLQGANLGGTLRAPVTIPVDTPPGLFWTTAKTAKGFALPVPLLIDSSIVAGITETDATMPLPFPTSGPSPQTGSLPSALEGTFTVYPRILFFFLATPADHLVFDLFGRRIGSRIDGALRITDPNGKEMAANDDAPGAGKDARLEFTPPYEDIYTVEARNVEGKLGPDYYYRLAIRRAAPDFRLLLNQDHIQVPAGESVTVPITVERLRGFEGPVKLGVEGLPAGVSFRGGVIPPGQTQLEVAFSASPKASQGVSTLHLRGSTLLAGKSVVHDVVAREPYMPGASGNGNAWRDCLLLPLAITARP